MTKEPQTATKVSPDLTAGVKGMYTSTSTCVQLVHLLSNYFPLLSSTAAVFAVHEVRLGCQPHV